VSIPRFNQLVEFNPKNYNEIIGELATGWDLSSDGRTYTFSIHPNANWHDGEPVTASDVAFSLDRIVDPDAIRPQAGAALRPFYERGTATALDPKTVEVPLYFPSAAFLPWLAFPLIAMYPRHVVEGLSQADANCCYENLVGSGPFILKDFQRGSHIKWEKNPDYFRPGQPFLDGMDHFKILDPNRAILGMKTGQLVAFANFFQSGSTIDVFQQLEADTNGEVKTVEVKNAINRGLIINWTKPPLDNPNVRKAIMLALDRVEYVKTIWKGFGRQGTFIPGGSSVDHAEQNWPGWRYVDADGNLLTTDPVQVEGARKHPDDIAEAQRLMEEAGAMGAQLDMLVFTIPAYQSIGQITAQQMKKYFDWDVTVRAVDLAAAMEESFAGRFDLYADGSLVPLADASTLLSQHYQAGGGRNPLNWFDERIDKLGAEAFRATTIEDRKAKYLEIEQIFVDEGHAQFIPVGWFPYVGGVNVKLRNFNMPLPGDVGYSPMIVAAQAEHWWFDDDATGFWPLGP
jgi:peptide/nickel transport system substrate-binding protein